MPIGEADYDEGQLRVRLGKGNGKFGSYIESSGSKRHDTKFYFHDFNGDGIVDNAYWNPKHDGGKLRI